MSEFVICCQSSIMQSNFFTKNHRLFNVKCISYERQEKFSQRVFMGAVSQEFSDYSPKIGSVQFATFEIDLVFDSVQFEENANRPH